MKTILTLSFFLVGLTCFSQGINYQAVARNSDGEILANQPLTVFFSVFSANSGNPVFEERHQTITDAFGQFVLVIGKGEALAGNFNGIDWSEGEHEMGLRLDAGNGEVDLGRLPFRGVPYSFFAERAGSVELRLEELTDVSGSAPAFGEVLKWDGQAWTPAADAGGVSYEAGDGIEIDGEVIRNTGDTDADDDLTTGSVAGGDAGGTFDNLTVTGLRGRDLADLPPNNGQVLAWNGGQNRWQPASINFPSFQAGQGILINSNTISNTGDLDPDDDLLKNSTAGGDLTGLFSNLLVTGLRGRPLANQSPSTGQVLKWDGSAWTPGTDLSGASFWTQNNNRLFYNDGFVGIGTNNPLSRLHVNNGDILIQDDFPGLTLSGAGANKFISFRQGNQEQGGIVYSNAIGLKAFAGNFNSPGSWVLTPAGNFGVGLNDPAEKLHVDGGIRLGNTNNGQPGALRWTGGDFEGFKNDQWVSLTRGGDALWSANGPDALFTNGKVGIGPGSNSPFGRLSLYHQSSLSGPHLWLKEINPSGHARINLGNENAPNQRFWILDARSGDGANTSSEFRVLFNQSTTAITKFSIGTDRITLGGFGENIGIGLGNPSERLHVLGGIRIGNTTGAGAGTIRWTGTDFEGRTGSQWVSLTGGGSNLWSQTGNVLFYTEGGVGIGTKAPGGLLTLSRQNQAAKHQLELRNEGQITTGNFDGIAFTQGATGSTRLASIQLNYNNNGQPDMAFHLRNQSNVLFLDAGGNVGVRTNNPAVPLDVNGNIRTNGEVLRTTTGTANLVPVAYGNISSDGKINKSTGNISVSRKSAGNYEISINGESVFFEDYIITANVSGEAGFVSYSSINGKLLIKTYNLIGVVIAADRNFSFVVYKP